MMADDSMFWLDQRVVVAHAEPLLSHFLNAQGTVRYVMADGALRVTLDDFGPDWFFRPEQLEIAS